METVTVSNKPLDVLAMSALQSRCQDCQSWSAIHHHIETSSLKSTVPYAVTSHLLLHTLLVMYCIVYSNERIECIKREYNLNLMVLLLFFYYYYFKFIYYYLIYIYIYIYIIFYLLLLLFFFLFFFFLFFFRNLLYE